MEEPDMAFNASTICGRFLKFESAAIDPRALALVSFEGSEAISRPYRFEIDLASEPVDLDLPALLRQPAFLGIKQGIALRGDGRRGIRSLRIHGMLASFEQRSHVEYRAVLVPRLWRLSLHTQSRIFLEKSIPQIVEEVLRDHGLSEDDYEFRLDTSRYPTQEFVVQVQESDLNFLHRLLEHVGIFYFFVQGEDREKVIFGDSARTYEILVNPESLPYLPRESARWLDPEVVLDFRARAQLQPNEIVLRDYNWRTPSASLLATANHSDGYGRYYEYGAHYKNADEGARLAQVRAEEFEGRRLWFSGASDCRAFRAGMTWKLEGRFGEEYLLTEVHHKASQAAASTGAAPTYENRFAAISSTLVFRPERVTPKPRIHGVLNARIDAAGNGQYAEIDDQGRYKVVLPFDLSGKNGGTASRYVRMAQPYAGPGMGMHFPLHKGTEVALAFVNGDPDRPIIVGAIPNPEMASTVASGNCSQSRIHTGGGNSITIEDQEGGQRISLVSPHLGTFLSMGAPR